MFRPLASLLATALAAVALPAAADEVPLEGPAVPAGYRTHDGFFLQLQAGPAYLVLDGEATAGEDIYADTYTPGSMTVQGGGLGFDALVGGSPVRNLVIFGEVLTYTASNPAVSLDGIDYGSVPADLSFTFVGPGVAYYFGRTNLFASAATGVTVASIAVDGGVGSAGGIGYKFAFGKEWWVGGQWGLGLAASYFGGVLADAEAVYAAGAFGLNASATFQ